MHLSIPFRIPGRISRGIGWFWGPVSFNSFPDSSRRRRGSARHRLQLSIPFRIPVASRICGSVRRSLRGLSIPFRIPGVNGELRRVELDYQLSIPFRIPAEYHPLDSRVVGPLLSIPFRIPGYVNNLIKDQLRGTFNSFPDSSEHRELG